VCERRERRDEEKKERETRETKHKKGFFLMKLKKGSRRQYV
jgi:hypothetical protein